MKEIPVCPNCTSRKIKQSFVKKIDTPETKDITLTEYNDKAKIPTMWGLQIAGDCINRDIYIQIVAQCEECGYIVVKNLT